MAVPGVDSEDSIDVNLSVFAANGVKKLDVRAYAIGSTKVRRWGSKFLRCIEGIGAGVTYSIFNNNLRNLVDAITKRVYFVKSAGGYRAPPKPIDGFVSRLDRIRAQLIDTVHRPPVLQVRDYPQLYTGRFRKRYEMAAGKLIRGFVPRRDRVATGFLKTEAVMRKPGKPLVPRMITMFTPEYNILTGRYLKNFEGCLAKAFQKVAGYPVICKGFNAEQVARKLRTDWDSFSKPVAIGLDASRFDQHVSNEMLQWEFSLYNAVFQSDELAELLSWQINPSVVARAADGEVRYTGQGRSSGVINTGMGNCLIMSSMVLTYAREHGVNMRLSNNGDDCVCVMESRDLAKFCGDLVPWFRNMGFTMEVEDPVYVFERIEFCQAQPVWAGRWIMSRNPYKHADKDRCSTVGWDTGDDVAAWLHTVSVGGRSLTTGMPFWYAWYGCLGSGSDMSDARFNNVLDNGRWRYMLNGLRLEDEHVITPESRVSFWKAYGMLPDVQVALENIQFTVRHARPVVKSGTFDQPPLHQLLSQALQVQY